MLIVGDLNTPGQIIQTPPPKKTELTYTLEEMDLTFTEH
jgi:hypothetical protein